MYNNQRARDKCTVRPGSRCDMRQTRIIITATEYHKDEAFSADETYWMICFKQAVDHFDVNLSITFSRKRIFTFSFPVTLTFDL